MVLVAGACGGDDERGLAVADPVAAPARPSAELAMTRVVTGNPPRRELILVDEDGRVARRLADDASRPRPAWSPDGRRVAYTGVSEHGVDEATDVYVVGAAGGRPTRLTRSGHDFAPVWSPDGRTIVFAHQRPDERFAFDTELWAVDAGGGEPRRLLENDAGTRDLPSSFSPDGSQLAFTRCASPPRGEGGRVANTCGVHVLEVRSLDVRRLAQRAAEPVFSPDGSKLAFVSDRDRHGELSYGDRVSYANELYVMDADGENARRLTRTRDLNERSPAWSPDGTLIAYERGEVTGNAEATSVLTIRADGSCARRVAHDPGLSVWYHGPAWRPTAPRAQPDRGCRAPTRTSPLVPLAGNLSLDAARRFRPFDLYWVGRRFEQFVLSSLSQNPYSGPGGRGPVVDLIYGGFQIQLWPACVRVPTHVALPPDGRPRVRGVEAWLFEGGSRLELVTGRTTIVVFGARDLILRVARSLRGLSVGRGPAAELPAPAPGALERTLTC